MHRAPVVGILVLDGHSVPLPEPLEVAHDLSKSPDMQGSHQLLVVSEEQFKVLHGGGGGGVLGTLGPSRGSHRGHSDSGWDSPTVVCAVGMCSKGCRGTGKERGLWRPRAQLRGGDTEAGPVCGRDRRCRRGRKWPSTRWTQGSGAWAWPWE